LDYEEAHGDADKLLKYRMSQLTSWANLRSDDVVLDVGCGNGHHLFFLAPLIARGIGIDFSNNMIEAAQNALTNSLYTEKLQFQRDNARELKTIADESINVVICIGSFEHLLEKQKVIRQFQRVLKPEGRLVLMTPHGDYLWYRFFAPLFKLQTRHLSTDLFLSGGQLKEKLEEGKFSNINIGYWTFIPRGDMSGFWGLFLRILDVLGRFLKIAKFRGGIIARADKP
jgi:2-polyprenyl-6-hydroxyphenyl methylase/3-demethylubiquinone-9 3-methyltransferase